MEDDRNLGVAANDEYVDAESNQDVVDVTVERASSSDSDANVPSERIRHSNSSTSSDEFYSAEENQVENHHTLHVPGSSFNFDFRPRSNSEIEHDIIVSHPAVEPQREERRYPPLTQSLEEHHSRGVFLMPTIKDAHYQKDEYDMLSEEPGEVFIFNFETYLNQKHSPRFGTRLDVRALIDTLGRLKFNIPKERIYNDLTKDKVLDAIKSACSVFDMNKNKPKINCLIVVFLTHGLANNIIATYDMEMHVEDVIDEFNNCVALQDVPKWFTFLACKEPISKLQDHAVIKKHKKQSIVSKRTYLHPLPNDVILYYSTTEENRSARVREEGTWVIQELCQTLIGYGRRDELFSILTRTNKCIANNYIVLSAANSEEKSEEKNIDRFRQCPVILSTLTKKFFLTLSKDRVAQLETLTMIHNIKNN